MGDSMDVTLGGVVVPGMKVLSSAHPGPGDTCLVLDNGGDPIVLGTVDGTGTVAVQADQVEDDADSFVVAGGTGYPGVDLLNVDFTVLAAAGTSPRLIHVQFGFVGVTGGNAGGYYYVTLDGDSGFIGLGEGGSFNGVEALSGGLSQMRTSSPRKWHTLGLAAPLQASWSAWLLASPGPNRLSMYVVSDTGSVSMTAWFPRIDWTQLG